MIDQTPAANSAALSANLVNLLWTGGWDSTYRLIDLIRNSKICVQPHYYIATRRPSTIKEIETMGKLRRIITERFDSAGERLLPTRYYSVHEIPRSLLVKEKIGRIRSSVHVGTQYETLINLAQWQKISDLELGIQLSGRASGLPAYIRNRAIAIQGPDGRTNYVVRSSSAESDEEIFSNFRFPILYITKKDMLDSARQNGFLDIMHQTWFCHDPIRGKPCGLCAPCGFVLDDGLSSRLSSAARLRHRLSPFYMLFPRNRARRF